MAKKKTHKCKVCKKNIRQSGPGRPKLTHTRCKGKKKTPVRRTKKKTTRKKVAKKKTTRKKVAKKKTTRKKVAKKRTIKKKTKKKTVRKKASKKPRGAKTSKPTKSQFGGSKMDALDKMEYKLALEDWKLQGYWIY